MNFLKQIYNFFPNKFKRKSLIFIFLLLVATFLETIGIGMIFPLIEILIKGNFSKNILGVNFSEIFSDLSKVDIIKNLIFFIIFMYFLKTIYLIYFNFWQLRFSTNIYKYLSLKLFNKYLYSPVSYINNKNSSELLRNTMILSKEFGSCVSLFLRLTVEFLVTIFIISLVLYIEFLVTLKIFFILITFIIIFYFLTKKKNF